MPIYEYACPQCAHIVEVMQDFDAPAPSACEACGQKGAALSKVMSRTSFQLKGTGWYSTDYKKSSGASSSPSSTSPSSTPSAPPAPKSDT